MDFENIAVKVGLENNSNLSMEMVHDTETGDWSKEADLDTKLIGRLDVEKLNNSRTTGLRLSTGGFYNSSGYVESYSYSNAGVFGQIGVFARRDINSTNIFATGGINTRFNYEVSKNSSGYSSYTYPSASLSMGGEGSIGYTFSQGSLSAELYGQVNTPVIEIRNLSDYEGTTILDPLVIGGRMGVEF